MPRTVAIYNGDNNAIEESLVSVEKRDGVSGRRGEGARGKGAPSSMTTSEESENRLAMAVEFDHMYIGCSDSKASVGKDLEVQHLKDLLLLHLDLIQQQAEQLVAKDKQIKILRDENENLRAKLERIDRRVSLSLHKKATEAALATEPQAEQSIEDGSDPDLSFVKSEVEESVANPLSPNSARASVNKVISLVKNAASGSSSNKVATAVSKPTSPLNKSVAPPPKPGTPSTKQVSPSSKPGSPTSKPGSPSSKPVSPASKPGSPLNRLGSPPSKPGSPPSKPGSPPCKPGSPTSKPGSPPSKSCSPSSKPASPSNRSILPGSKPGSPSAKPSSPPTKAVSPSNKTGSPVSLAGSPGSKPSSPVSKNGSPGTKVVLPANKLGTPINKSTPVGAKATSLGSKVETPSNKIESVCKSSTPVRAGKSDQLRKIIPKVATPKISPRERRPRRDTAQSIPSENESDLDLLLEPSKKDLTRNNERRERCGQKRRSESESELPPKRIRSERERSESGNDATDHNLRSKSEKSKERPKDSAKHEDSPSPAVDRPATPTSRAAALEAKKLRQKLQLKEQSSRGQPFGEKRAGEPPMGRSVRGEGILNTSVAYYLPYGGIIQDPNPEEECLQAQVEIPRWGTRVLTSLYVMEGTENLEDEVFLKRHAKPEQDEKRRKRWDLQRMREQRHYERLRERYEGRQNASEPEVSVQGSLWPNPESALYLHVDDCLPVCAFGQPMARIPPEEFALPWLTGRCTDGVSTRRRKR